MRVTLCFATVTLLLATVQGMVIEHPLSTYTNPIIGTNSPDPGAMWLENNVLVVVTTSPDNSQPDKFPIHTSMDGSATWNLEGFVFPKDCNQNCAKWGKMDFWAPEIHAVNGRYHIYYTSRGSDHKLAVGVATSDKPFGPYVDNDGPLVHNSSMGYIDATYFRDTDGKHYLIWKADGNDIGQPTPIYQQELSQDGLGFADKSERRILITNDLDWEFNLVEGPWMILHNQTYFLFYSANSYASPAYAVGVAHSLSIHGPFQKLRQPILHTENVASPVFSGPGHCSVLNGPDGRLFMLYHAWEGSRIGGNNARFLLMDEVQIDGVAVTVGQTGTPSSTSLPVPW